MYSIFKTQAEISSEKIGVFSTKLDRFITKKTRICIFIYGLFTEAVTG